MSLFSCSPSSFSQDVFSISKPPFSTGAMIICASSPESATSVNARSCQMTILARAAHLIAIFVFAFEMPVPVYWLILHQPVLFWRKHVRAAFPVAVAAAWGIVDLLLYRFHVELFRRDGISWPALLGLVLIGVDVFTFVKSEAVLGGRRIVGPSELAGRRDLI